MWLSKYCWALTRFILVWILLIPQRHQVRSKLGGNPTFEESTMTLTVRLLVCWGRRSLYSLLKGYRERPGGGRWEVACLDDRHSSGHHSGYHAGRHSAHHLRSLPPPPPRRHGEAEGGRWKQCNDWKYFPDMEERRVVEWVKVRWGDILTSGRQVTLCMTLTLDSPAFGLQRIRVNTFTGGNPGLEWTSLDSPSSGMMSSNIFKFLKTKRQVKLIRASYNLIPGD